MTHRLALPFDQTASVLARRYLLQALRIDSDGLGWDEIGVVVSELVSNGVRHGRPELELHAGLDRTTLRVEVVDGGRWTTWDPSGRSPDYAGGRGLEIVEGLSDAWGRRSDGKGTMAWARFDRGRYSPEPDHRY